MESVYKKNIDSFMRIANNRKEIIEYISTCSADHVVIENGTFGVVRNQRLWMMVSTYNPELCVKAFANQYKSTNAEEVIIILGFGDGSYIREVLLANPEKYVVVLEPDGGIIKKVMETIDVSDVLSDKRLALAVSTPSIAILKEYFMVLLKYSNVMESRVVALPGYRQAYPEWYELLFNEYKNRVQSIYIDRNTRITFGIEAVTNCVNTLRDGIDQYCIDDVKKAFEPYINDKSTAILVAAGPSLDKNIGILNEAKGKAFIFAVDSALKATLRNGIIPDMTMTVDSHKHRVLFEHEGFSDIPMVVCQSSNYKIYDLHSAKRFYYSNHEDLLDYVYMKCGKKINALESGGSVANSAFSMLVYMGFKNIVLIGQDLAYPNKQLHSKEAYDGKEKSLDETDGKKYFYVDGVDGNQILTEHNMNEYRKWFESYILRHKELCVIDATEGGALIHGTKLKTLREVIDGLEGKFNYDIKKVFESIKPSFESKEAAEAVIDNLSSDIRERREILRDGIEAYDKLLKLAVNHKLHTGEAGRLVEVINTLNTKCEEDKILRFVTKYDAKSFYDIEDSKKIATEKESEYTKIAKAKDIDEARYKVYLKCLEEFERDIENI